MSVYLISEEDRRMLLELLQWKRSLNGPDVTNAPDGVSMGAQPRRGRKASPLLQRLSNAIDGAPTIITLGEGGETADTTTWDRTNQAEDENGVQLNMVTRVVYNDTGDEKLYGFQRTLTFDKSGRLKTVSAETRYEIDAAEDC